MSKFIPTVSGLNVVGSSRFASLVAEIAPSLQALRAATGVHRTFVHRLMFVVRYAEFFQRLNNGEREDAALDLISMFEEDLVPKSWWGVLLYDAIDFLLPGKSSLLAAEYTFKDFMFTFV